MGISTNFWSIDERGNAVGVGVDPLTAEVEQLFRKRYGHPVVLEYSPESPPYLHTPWPSVPEVLHAVLKDDAEEFLTCGGEKFPATALDGPGGAEDMDGPVYDGLRETIRVFGTEFGGTGHLSWVLVFQDETRANFMARDGDLWLEANTELENGSWYGAGMGQCRPIVAPAGDYGPAEWALDPDYPAPEPADTEIHALVWERACSSGRPSSGRMSPPTVEYLDESLTIAIGVKPVPGAQNCLGPPGTPVTFVLPQPIGDRTLLDGGTSPPAAPTNPFGP